MNVVFGHMSIEMFLSLRNLYAKSESNMNMPLSVIGGVISVLS